MAILRPLPGGCCSVRCGTGLCWVKVWEELQSHAWGILCLLPLLLQTALASLFKWIFITSGLVSDTQLHVCTFSSPLDTHQWPFSVGQEASVPKVGRLHWGLRQSRGWGGGGAQGPSDAIVSRALRPVEILNTFSLEIQTPQMPQNSQVLLTLGATPQGTLSPGVENGC